MFKKHTITDIQITGEYDTSIFLDVRVLTTRLIRKPKVKWHKVQAPVYDDKIGRPRFTDDIRKIYEVYNVELAKDLKKKIIELRNQ